MESVKIEEIANELGMRSKELVKKVQVLYQDVKSPKSKVTPEQAQEIFNSIVLCINKPNHDAVSTYQIKNITLHFSSEKIDIGMLDNIASTYKLENQKEFMVRSYNFSELSIVKLLVAGFINLDIKKYIEMKSTRKELDNLLNNMNKIIDEVDFENIDDINPLYNFQNYVEEYKPEIVYIEGIDYHNYLMYKDVFKLIKKLSSKGVLFELGFCNINPKHIKEIKKGFSNEN